MKPVKKEQRALSDDEIVAILKAERFAALGTDTSSDLSEQRIQALDYYMGDMTSRLPAEDGQSAAVSTDVQDVVEGVLPIILDVFVSGDKVIEFKPIGPNDEAAAEQETDVVNHVFYQENDGFLTLYTAIKDALLQKNCFVKWWVEDDTDRSREAYTGLTQDAYGLIVADKDVEIVEGSEEQYQDADPLTGQPATFYNCTVETKKNVKRFKIAAVPPEEVLVHKNARTTRDATYIAHVQFKPQADAIALYPKQEEIIRAAPSSTLAADNSEATERQTVQDNQDQLQTGDDANKDMRLIEIVEHYIRFALEKDKIARRYRVTTVGTKYDILDIQEVSQFQMATGTAILMSHRLFGRSLADLTIDIQEIKTSLIRATLNNAYYANNQRMEIAESHAGENTIDDLLNNRVGGLVRTKMPGGLNMLPAQPIGNWVMSTIEYFDSVKENRTGVSRYSQGLDGDSLNHTATGISRIMDAAEMRVKLMARIFAETLLVDIFRGLHQLIQEHSEEALTVKLRGQWVKVDPREWKNRRHMTISLPVGGLGKQQMIQFLMGVLTTQETIAEKTGTNGPLVSLQNIRNTLDHIMKIAGFKTADPFFMQPGPPNPNAPPPPNPKMVEAQGKVQALKDATQAKIAGDQQQAQSDQQADAARFAHDQQMEYQKAAAQHQREVEEFQHKAALDKMKFEHEAAMEQFKAGVKLRLETHIADEKMKIEREKAEQAAALNRQQAALQREPGVNNV